MVHIIIIGVVFINTLLIFVSLLIFATMMIDLANVTVAAVVKSVHYLYLGQLGLELALISVNDISYDEEWTFAISAAERVVTKTNGDVPSKDRRHQ